MENTNNFTAEDLKKCPYHSQQFNLQSNDEPGQNVNTGDWGDLDDTDEAGTDPDSNEQGGNDNSGGAGSTGSAATNS